VIELVLVMIVIDEDRQEEVLRHLPVPLNRQIQHHPVRGGVEVQRGDQEDESVYVLIILLSLILRAPAQMTSLQRSLVST
jgi:hypothetical protein